MIVNKIIPRYEFRAFAQNFGLVETQMRALSKCEMIRESSEIYIVSATNKGDMINGKRNRKKISGKK